MRLSSYVKVAANVAEFKIKPVPAVLKAVHSLLTLTTSLNITQMPLRVFLPASW
jgi:hypothetical protein